MSSPTGMFVDYRSAEKLVKKMVKAYERERMEEYVHEFAVMAQKRLVDSIWQQTLGFKPLSIAYRRRKARAGLDRRTLIATHSYLAAIQVQRRRGGSAVVLANRRTKAGVPMRDLAYWLEYGATVHHGGGKVSHTPPRPHWRPLVKWAEQAWTAYMKGRVSNSVRSP